MLVKLRGKHNRKSSFHSKPFYDNRYLKQYLNMAANALKDFSNKSHFQN